MKQVKELRRNIRQYLEDKNKFDFDTRISHLLPQKEKGIARVFIFSEVRKGASNKVTNPYATVDVNIIDGTVLNYRELVEETKSLEWVEYTPNLYKNTCEDISEIFDIGECIMEIVFKPKGELNDDLKNKISRLNELYQSAIPQEMMSTYYAFGKDYFDWLKE